MSRAVWDVAMREGKSRGKVVVGLGEFLWDLLPEGPRLGGAPANFAVMAGRLGNRAVIASRVGQDALGAEAREKLAELPVESGWVQTDRELPTGTVTVVLERGEPEYTIHQPVAWDRLELSPAWRELAASADAVCWGTLGQRSAAARETIQGFLASTRRDCVRILDVNLRPPHWSAEALRGSLGWATIVKLNHAELPEVLRASGACPYPTVAEDDEELLRGARRLLERYPLTMVCVTLGARGSLLVTRTHRHRHPGRPVRVRDTVGAGDAFTAALAHYFLGGAPLPVLNEAGNWWGAWVASQPGAMPELEEATRAEMQAAIEAAAGFVIERGTL